MTVGRRTTDLAGAQDQRVAGLAESFRAAGDAIGEISVERLWISGALVLLCFASRALRDRLLPAFAHLAEAAERESATAPTLTVHLWDSASTGAQLFVRVKYARRSVRVAVGEV